MGRNCWFSVLVDELLTDLKETDAPQIPQGKIQEEHASNNCSHSDTIWSYSLIIILATA